MLGLTVLGSGSRGNAIVLHSDSGAVLIDAGFSGIETRRRLEAVGIDEGAISAILVSHEHGDHVSGLRVLANRWDIPAYANRLTAEAVRASRHTFDRWNLFTNGAEFAVGDFRITPFAIPHDAIDPVAFVIRNGDHKIGIATDLGHVGHLVSHQLRECDALIIETNHDIAMLRDSSRPWSLKQRIMGKHGHLSNDAGMQLLRQTLHQRTQHVVLAHASEECNDYDLVGECAFRCLAELERGDLTPTVARQDGPLETLWLG